MTTKNQRRSRKQEKRGARVYGGIRNSGSGNTTGHKNDVRSSTLSIEFKTTTNKSYGLKLAELQAAEDNALLDGRNALFGIDFEEQHLGKRKTFRYVVQTEYDFLEIKRRLEQAESEAERYRDDASYWEHEYYCARDEIASELL
jgi:hypothetical protein